MSTISLRLPESLHKSVRELAKKEDVSFVFSGKVYLVEDIGTSAHTLHPALTRPSTARPRRNPATLAG